MKLKLTSRAPLVPRPAAPAPPRPATPPPPSSPLLSRALAAILAAQLALAPLAAPPPAAAILNSPNAQIARSVDAALRRSVPAFNPEVEKVQDLLEDIQFLNRIPQRKPFGSMAGAYAFLCFLLYNGNGNSFCLPSLISFFRLWSFAIVSLITQRGHD